MIAHSCAPLPDPSAFIAIRSAAPASPPTPMHAAVADFNSSEANMF